MKTYISNPSGYCQGVQRAIALAMNFKNLHKNNKVYVLGTLVHNETVTRDLEKYGIFSLNQNLSNEEKISSLNKNDCLIFSAHGHDKKLEILCDKKGIVYFDATCPIVSLTSQNISKSINEGHQVIYVGAKNHPEAKAMLSLSNNIFLFNDIKDDMHKFITDNSPFVSNQTTLSMYELEEIFKYIKKEFPNAKFQNEICSETKRRQEAIFNLPDNVDCVFVVGGKDSSNTLKLYELAKKHFTTLKIYRIIDEDDIEPNKIKGCLSAAIISGASTPINETMKIKVKLDEIW